MPGARFHAASAFLIAMAVAPMFLPTGAAGVAQAADRPAMDSYQPYAGLQYGFRPVPPARRGVAHTRPQVVAPTRQAPVIEYGGGYSAEGHTYCAAPFQGVEPRDNAYATSPGEGQACR